MLPFLLLFSSIYLILVMSSSTTDKKFEKEQEDETTFKELLSLYRLAIRCVMAMDKTSKYCDLYLDAYYCELVAFCDARLDYPEYRKRLPRPPQ